MLQPCFSVAGTQEKEREEACYIFFMDFLDECEGMLNVINFVAFK